MSADPTAPEALLNELRRLREALSRERESVARERALSQALSLDLQAAEQRYAAMVEDQSDLVVLLDDQARLQYANRAFAERCGETAEYLVGSPLTDWIEPEDARALLGQLRQSLQRGGPIVGESRLLGAAREPRWIEWTHRPVRGQGNAALHSVGRDITQRKQLERRLVASETQYRTLFDHMQNGFVLHEMLLDARGEPADLRYLAANAAFARMLGFTQAQLIGARLSELYPGDNPEGREWLRTFVRVAMDGASLRFERYSPAFDRWYDVIAYRPAPMQFAAIVTDITDRRRAQESVEAQHEQLRVTLHSIGDAVITTDNLARVEYLNPAAERLTGWRDGDARGRPIDAVFRTIDDASREPLPDPVQRCLAAERASEDAAARRAGDEPAGADVAQAPASGAAATLINRHGTEIGIEETVSPIRGSDGRVRGAVLVFRDVSDQRRMAREMSYRATHDALTGLVNRSAFEARLQHTLRLAQADGSVHALMYIDLDQFKLVNDACGHAAGDGLLRQVAALLKQCVRTRDTLARLGGDEFGVILEFCPTDQAMRVAQQICARMDEYRFVHEERRFRVGTSIGLVPLDGRWPSTQTVMQAADSACYAAKEAGRNRVHAWFDADHHLRLRHGEMQWVTRLEQALDESRFELFGQRIQPICAEPRGLHCEVLLRLRGEDGQLVPPGAFLPAAERFHMATRIDRYVVAAVVEWMASRADALGHVGTIAVNLSGQSISDPSFLRQVTDVVGAVDFARHKLCFEVTETAAITNMAEATHFVDVMRGQGIRFALDDFGAGASSFGYLKTLSVDYLKIDGQFIRDLLEDPLDLATVRCFRDVAEAVGTRTIAEFVESEEIAQMLSDIGIDYGQGYLYHRPEPIDAAVGLTAPLPAEALRPAAGPLTRPAGLEGWDVML